MQLLEPIFREGLPNRPFSYPHVASSCSTTMLQRVARVMREAGLRVHSRMRWRLVFSSSHDLPIAPNRLDCQFASDRARRH